MGNCFKQREAYAKKFNKCKNEIEEQLDLVRIIKLLKKIDAHGGRNSNHLDCSMDSE